MSKWRVRLTVTEQHPEATHPRTSDRFYEVEATDELGGINEALALVFAKAAEHRSSISGVLIDRALEMP